MYKGKISNTYKTIFIPTTKTLISESPRVVFVVGWDRLVRLLYIQISDWQSHWDWLVRLLYTQSEPVSLVCRARRHLSFDVTLQTFSNFELTLQHLQRLWVLMWLYTISTFEFWCDSTQFRVLSFDVTLHNYHIWVLMWLYTISSFEFWRDSTQILSFDMTLVILNLLRNNDRIFADLLEAVGLADFSSTRSFRR